MALDPKSAQSPSSGTNPRGPDQSRRAVPSRIRGFRAL